MRKGLVPAHYAQAAEQLAHAWRVHAVRVTRSRPVGHGCSPPAPTRSSR
jgi:hypothetical protein